MSVIRKAELSDAADIAAIYAPYVRDTAITFELDAPSEEEMRRRIGDVLSYSTYIVCEHEKKVLGYAYGAKFRVRAAYQWASETTVYVDQKSHGRGIGPALYTSLMECLRLHGFTVAIGVITLPNSASIALHERMGFKHIGDTRATGYKLGKWHDVGWYELALCELPTNPQPPKTLAEIGDTRQWQAALNSGARLLKI
jgi:L-amino acid N-acyltransferase YncA